MGSNPISALIKNKHRGGMGRHTIFRLWLLRVQVPPMVILDGNSLMVRTLYCDYKNVGSNPIYHQIFKFIKRKVWSDSLNGRASRS
jgi:hypothetical protein